MSNVIPQEARKGVRRMYRARYLLAGSAVMTAGALLCAVAFLPSYLALNAVAPASTPEQGSAPDEQDRTDIARAQSLMQALAPLIATTTTPTDIVALALDKRPRGVHVDHITYSAGEDGVMTILGSADAPTAIDAFRKALAAESRFKSVSVPVGDLVSTDGGRFSMTLTGAF